MPTIQPAELWRESGRYEAYGKEMLRITDRHDRDLLYGPTNEEMVTEIFRAYVRSYKSLPLNLYHTQWKFRDEVRPRFGLMRGREFIMKDAYSFHVDEADLEREYANMFEAYTRIFTRLGLKFRAVEADTGSIGGNASHEFHVLADSGEDVIAHCDACRYAANVEKAEGRRSLPLDVAGGLAEVATPGASAIGDGAARLAGHELPRVRAQAGSGASAAAGPAGPGAAFAGRSDLSRTAVAHLRQGGRRARSSWRGSWR